MSVADDIIEARCSGISLEDIYSLIKSGTSLEHAELADSVSAIRELLEQQLREIASVVESNEFITLRSNAATLRDVAAMLDGIVDEIGG